MKNDKMLVPQISYGLIKNKSKLNGFYFTLPFKGISLNEYKKMHHGKIAKERGHYKSILDVMAVSCMNKIRIGYSYDEGGIHLHAPMFKDRIDIEWMLTFETKRLRDAANYTQKILLDAIVDIGFIKDDSYKFVNSDKTFFGDAKYNSITCIMLGDVYNTYFINSTISVSYQDLLKTVGGKK